jgi:hypothetical protein
MYEITLKLSQMLPEDAAVGRWSNIMEETALLGDEISAPDVSVQDDVL